MIYYTIYKITNTVNGKIYIGKHKTKNINDEYMGSGKILKRALVKYGPAMFRKEILYLFNNENDMNLMEEEIVNEEFISRLDTYNLKVGGEGGWDHINNNGLNNLSENAIKMNKTLWENKEFRKRKSDQLKKLHKEGKIRYWVDNYSWVGKKHTEDSKKKIGKASAVHQKGKKNSQYRTCWIYNESSSENKKIKNHDISSYLAQGWVRGRKMK